MPLTGSAQEESQVSGACCFNSGACSETSDLVCSIWGGIFFPGGNCADIDCPTNCGGGCSPGEVYDCLGHCFPANWVGDGFCDDGDFQWDTHTIYLNCEEHAWDGGDCTPPDSIPVGYGACRMQSLTDCDDPCVCDVMTLDDCIAMGNGTFLGWGTTCLDSTCDCPPGFTSDCSGNCFPIHMIANGFCQHDEYYDPPDPDETGFWLDLTCLEIACDGGDCTGNCSGACCLGGDCIDAMSMIDCTEQGGVFLGPAITCIGVNCNDYLAPITLSLPLSEGDAFEDRSLDYSVSTGNGITACAFAHSSSDEAAVNVYQSLNESPVATILTGMTSSSTPLVDTDGSRIAIGIGGEILLYTEDGRGWTQEAIITTSYSELGQIIVEGDVIFASSGNEVEIHERIGTQWQYLRTLTGISGTIKDIDASGNSFALVSAWFVQVFEYPYTSYVRVDLWGTNGYVDLAIHDNLMVVSEGPGFYYGWWNADLPGQVFMYERSSPGSQFVLQDTLIALDSKSDDEFGQQVAVDDGTVLVTAPGHDGQLPDSGAVFVFRDVNGQWKQAGKIFPTNAVSSMGFGRVASIDDSLVSIGWARFTANGDLTLSGAETTLLAEHDWINADGGELDSSENWSPQAPDGDGSAVISIPNDMLISVSGSLPFENLVVGPSRPELDLQFQDATIGSGGSSNVFIAGAQNYKGNLSVNNGTLTVDGSMQVGSAPYRPGALTLADTGSVRVEGDYTQSKIGELAVVLNTRPDAALVVGGDVTINGTLSATCTFYNSDPEIGSTWSIIRSETGLDSITDRFQVAVLPGVGRDKYLKINYGESRGNALSIFLTVESIDGLFDVSPSSNLGVEGMATDLVVADLGSPAGPPDGFEDIALTIAGNPGEIFIFINDGMGGIDSQVTYVAGHNPSSISSGDFDQDGNIDLVITNADDDNVFLLLNDGGSVGTMSVQEAADTGDNPVDVAVLDVDTDGDDDVVVSCAGDGQVLPDGSIYGQVDFFEYVLGFRSSSLNKLGDVQTADQPGPIDPGELGNSKGGRKLIVGLRSANRIGRIGQSSLAGFNWTLEETYVVGTDPITLETGDLNNDGFDDVVVGNNDSGTVSVLLSDGVDSLIPESTFTVGDLPQSLTLLDYDGDMDLDLGVVAELSPGETAVMLYRNDSSLNENCGVTFSLEQTLEAGNNPILVGNGLLDNDAADDLVAITNNTLFRRGDSDDMVLSIMSAETMSHCYESGDVNMDNSVTIDDLLLLLNAWGQNYFDLNGDHIVNVDDLLIVINNWGPCSRS